MQASVNVTKTENNGINKYIRLYIDLSCIKILSMKSALTNLICFFPPHAFKINTIICIHRESQHFFNRPHIMLLYFCQYCYIISSFSMLVVFYFIVYDCESLK